jgi:hypothetical protein
LLNVPNTSISVAPISSATPATNLSRILPKRSGLPGRSSF